MTQFPPPPTFMDILFLLPSQALSLKGACFFSYTCVDEELEDLI